MVIKYSEIWRKRWQDFFTAERFISWRDSQDFYALMKNKLRQVPIWQVWWWPAVGLYKYRLRRMEILRKRHNSDFLRCALKKYQTFLDQVTKFPLDAQQRHAVLTDEDNHLVIAGAGSGKTMTIVAKIKYLVIIQGVPPRTILPISFTHASACDLKKRIGLPEVWPQTFHAFGLSVLSVVDGKKPNLFPTEQTSELLEKIVRTQVKDSAFLAKLNIFLLRYLKIPKTKNQFETKEKYQAYLRNQGFSALNWQNQKASEQKVFSVEHALIANWLFLHNIPYTYRTPYTEQNKYRPDFTIKYLKQTIYLDFFDTDTEGIPPTFLIKPYETPLIAKRRLERIIASRKKLHQKAQNNYVILYSYELEPDFSLDKLKGKLSAFFPCLKPKTQEEIWRIINNANPGLIQQFLRLVQTFLALYKGNQCQLVALHRKNQTLKQSNFLRYRAELFLQLFEPLFLAYEQALARRAQIDFHDMIIRATKYIEQGLYAHPINYVVVDEFQDLSLGRYKLLLAIRTQNPDVNFFCVGDDWQSIYRFAGSDITLFTQFSHYFGKAAISKIENTYRFAQPLIQLSSNFILQNPNQTPKRLRTPTKRQTNCYLLTAGLEPEAYSKTLIQAIKLFQREGLEAKTSIYLIGRYKFDLQKIIPLEESNLRLSVNEKERNVYLELEGETYILPFITAHKSKGLEADFGIILNCELGQFGFPSGRDDDPVLNLVLSDMDAFEYGEERRLFYVAMTRVRKAVAIIARENSKSPFFREMEKFAKTKQNDYTKKNNYG